MTMADLVVVMGEGRIRQAGSPLDIYRRPSDAFVAAFIGSTNLLPAQAGSGGARVPGGIDAGPCAPAGASGATVSVRPEDIRLVDPADAAHPRPRDLRARPRRERRDLRRLRRPGDRRGRPRRATGPTCTRAPRWAC